MFCRRLLRVETHLQLNTTNPINVVFKGTDHDLFMHKYAYEIDENEFNFEKNQFNNFVITESVNPG